MSDLQSKTKIYLRLAIASFILTVLLLGALRAWQPNTPIFSSFIDAVQTVLFFSLLPGAFVALAISTEKNIRTIRFIGILMVVTYFVAFAIMATVP